MIVLPSQNVLIILIVLHRRSNASDKSNLILVDRREYSIIVIKTNSFSVQITKHHNQTAFILQKNVKKYAYAQVLDVAK